MPTSELIKCHCLSTEQEKFVHRNNIRERVGVYAVIIDQNEILLTPLSNGLHFFPGGGKEPWETFEQAVKREVFEECGLDVKLIRSLSPTENFIIDFDGQAYHLTSIYFLASVSTRELPDTSKTREFCERQPVWVSLVDFDQSLLPKDQDKFMAVIFEALSLFP
ncbi:hypothetical protein A2533_04590 [Candidatus Falkowbacteria bacterium RIFOXYD2_FULL_35_9]|uniref:Nudix hydrolase domain-containing protein n=1 Tax=Candidatus Falkowbacteria bacterium RIFOXYC2_FULL_36_12 TaxID=1798002 RepID=A0A1F5T348_9BACT|nr:MAG: hypothetical protein A2300_01170 [Candidatus Falkowbacteria bacterium RIFOXYB2_FULL_35_7]OGF33370.1 MAG: hypothetical protein A2478_01565 [Candidatus Falkowbacteria bacterium RIFOXYC2_FULL_36_12]OGF46052.1 MAG: hypothetical protein A2533_04590 [Candidatus Falkowbacteria bacterium RIFOXYD2_FULL_35_9]